MSDEMRIDWGDGISAVDRTMRAIVMAADGVLGQLVDMGWRRESTNIELDRNNPLPCWITLRGKRVFEIAPKIGGPDGIVISGRWLVKVKGPNAFRKLFGKY